MLADAHQLGLAPCACIFNASLFVISAIIFKDKMKEYLLYERIISLKDKIIYVDVIISSTWPGLGRRPGRLGLRPAAKWP